MPWWASADALGAAQGAVGAQRRSAAASSRQRAAPCAGRMQSTMRRLHRACWLLQGRAKLGGPAQHSRPPQLRGLVRAGSGPTNCASLQPARERKGSTRFIDRRELTGKGGPARGRAAAGRHGDRGGAPHQGRDLHVSPPAGPHLAASPGSAIAPPRPSERGGRLAAIHHQSPRPAHAPCTRRRRRRSPAAAAASPLHCPPALFAAAARMPRRSRCG